jgi:hypothetical protein
MGHLGICSTDYHIIHTVCVLTDFTCDGRLAIAQITSNQIERDHRFEVVGGQPRKSESEEVEEGWGEGEREGFVIYEAGQALSEPVHWVVCLHRVRACRVGGAMVAVISLKGQCRQ